MDESRVLRDKLERAQVELRQSKEALARLRAHHAREREALEWQLGEARRELATLRARLGEAARSPASPEPAPEPPAPPRPEPTAATGLVALPRIPSLEEDNTLQRLSRVTWLSPADLRLRLAAPPPAILARLPPPESRALRDALRAEGFAAVSCELPSRTARPLPVRRFVLRQAGLSLESEQGERLEVPWSTLRLMVHGRRSVTTVETQEETVRDGRGRREAKLLEVKKEETLHFLWGYGEGLWLSFSRGTDFAGLGERRGMSHTTSLVSLIGEVRQLAPHVVIDDRLLRTAQLSLPLVDPERSHEALAELLWQSVRERPH